MRNITSIILVVCLSSFGLVGCPWDKKKMGVVPVEEFSETSRNFPLINANGETGALYTITRRDYTDRPAINGPDPKREVFLRITPYRDFPNGISIHVDNNNENCLDLYQYDNFIPVASQDEPIDIGVITNHGVLLQFSNFMLILGPEDEGSYSHRDSGWCR